MKRTIISAVLLYCIVFCSTSIKAQTLDSSATVMLNGWVAKYNLTPIQTQAIQPFIISEDSILLNLRSQPASKSNISLIYAIKKAYNDTIKNILKQNGISSNLTTLGYKYKLSASNKQSISPLLIAKVAAMQNIDTLNISSSTKDSLKFVIGTGFDNQITAVVESEMQWGLAVKYGITTNLDSVTTIKTLYNYNLKLIETQNKLGTDPSNAALLNTQLDMMIDPPALLARLIVSVRTAQNGNKGKYAW